MKTQLTPRLATFGCIAAAVAASRPPRRWRRPRRSPASRRPWPATLNAELNLRPLPAAMTDA